MTGGILTALGMLLASFATSLTHLYLSIGLLSGETLSRAGESKPESFWPQDFYLLPALKHTGCERRNTHTQELSGQSVQFAQFVSTEQTAVDRALWRRFPGFSLKPRTALLLIQNQPTPGKGVRT